MKNLTLIQGVIAMGRKAKIIYDDCNKPLFQNGGGKIIRVQYDKANDTYILMDGKRKILSRRKKAEIAYEFYKYAGKGAIELTTDERPIKLDSVIDGLEQGGEVEITIAEDGTVTASNIVELSPDIICKMFTELYYKNPITAEALTKIPNLSKLASMDFGYEEKVPRIPIDDILTAYITNPAYKNKPHLIKEANQYWGEFMAIVNREAGHKIKYLSEIKPEWIKTWQAEINKVATQKSYTKAYWLSERQRKELGRVKQYPRNTWQRKRVYGIKGLLTHYKLNKIFDPNSPQMKQVKDVEYVFSTIKAFEKPKPLPITIAPDIFKKFYDEASDRMKIMLALSVQCAFTNIDLFNLRKDDIDWDAGELNKMREKENKQRVAYISPFIIKMMKAYLKKHNESSEYVMISKGQRITALAIRKEFAKLRDTLHLDKGIQFKQLRKTALTKAAEAGASDRAIKVLAGHSTGISDAYVSRTIKQVKEACIYIANEYFVGLDE